MYDQGSMITPRFAEPNVEGNNPPHQQSDVMVDLERLGKRS